MRYLNRKGLAIEVIATMIILLVSFSVLFFIITEVWRPLATQSAKDYICKFSVYVAAKTKVIGKESLYGIKCDSREEKLNAKSIEEAKRKLADEVSHCWWKFGEGNLDFFSSWDFGFSQTRCIICSSITSDENDFKGEIGFKEFGEFLNKEKPVFSDKTYTEKFSGVENAEFNFEGEGNILVNKDNVNYVVFSVSHHHESLVAWLKQTLKLSAGGFVGGATLGAGVGSVVPLAGTSAGAVVGAIGGSVVGLVSSFGYKGKYYPGVMILSGKEVVGECETLE